MKKFILLCAAGLLFGGAAFAQSENGALGFGVMSDSSETGLVGGGIRGALFLDVGYQLTGPIYYGFEFQGAVKKLDQSSSSFSSTDVFAYYYGSSAVYFVSTSSYDQTYTLWDADFSPRGTISFDLGDKIQLLGFAGLNYNWQTLDYELRRTDGGTFTDPDGNSTSDYKTSTTLGGTWSAVAGFRVTVGAFYLDYTRFLQANNSGDYAWNKYNKDRLGLGINLRWQ